MDDSISRQAAINVVEEYLERYSQYIGTPKDSEWCGAKMEGEEK